MTTPLQLEVLGESTWRITAKINGIDTGVWDTMDGGDSEFNAGTYQPSGTGGVVAVRGGRQTASDITLTRGFYPSEWDVLNYVVGLGRGAKVDLAQAITDAEGTPDPAFRPATATAVLKTVQRPKATASSEGASMIGLVLTAVRWAKTPTSFGTSR